MTGWITIVAMIIIGALIGGVTNSLAIKMLFRPYKAVYIGKFKVPFTPGLIPKRRDELAKQLGKMVVTHLLTPERLTKNLTSNEMVGNIAAFITRLMKDWLQKTTSITQIATFFGIEDVEGKTTAAIKKTFTSRAEQWLQLHKGKSLRTILPIEAQEKIVASFPAISNTIVSRLDAYFSSEEGLDTLENVIQDFLRNKGMLGNMVTMFLGNVSLSEKIQPELLKFLRRQETPEMVEEFIVRQWQEWSETPLEQWISEEKGQQLIDATFDGFIQQVNISAILETPVQNWLKKYETTMEAKLIPTVVVSLLGKIEQYIPMIMQSLQVEKMVEEQVDSLPVAQLEELVLSISRKEFKMITVLGALLGGIIGLFQGILAMFL